MKKHVSAITLAAGMLLASTLLAFYLHEDVKEQVLSQFNESQLLIAQHVAGHIEWYFDARSQDVRYLASLTSLQHLDAMRMPADIQETFARLKTAYVKDIVVLDAAGKVVYSTAGDAIGSDNAGSGIDAWAKQPVNKGTVRLMLEKSATPLASATGEGFKPPSPRLFLLTPLYQEPRAGGLAGAGGTLTGVLLLTVDLERLVGGALGPRQPKNLHPSRIWVMDENGTLLLQSEHPEMVLRSIRGAVGACTRCHVSFDYAEKMLTAKQGTVEYQLVGQPSKVAAFAPITVAGVSWIVVLNAPRDDVTGFIRTNSLETLGLFGVVGIVVGIAFFSVYRNARQEIVVAEKARHWQEKEILIDELQESEAFLRQAQRLANVGSWKWDIATNAVRWSDELYRINGYDPTLPVPSFAEMSSFYTPESWTRLSEVVPKAVQAGEAYELELDHVRADGRVRRTLTRGEADRDASGKIVSLHGTVQDITERKQAERSIQEAQQRFQAVFDGSLDGIGIVKDGVHVLVNRAHAAMFGYEPHEVVGKKTFELVVPEDRVETTATDGEIATGSFRPHAIEFRGLRKDGTIFPAEITIGQFVLQGENYGVGIIRDVSERKRAEGEKATLEAQFLQAQKMESVGRLASGIAHDFNNLLTVINGTVELVLAQVSLDDPVHADLQEIYHAGERAATLTRQLLAFSRQQILKPRVMSLNTVVAGMESLLRRLLGEDIDLVVVPTQGLANVKVDPGQIEQVMTNLAVNARDAMPQGGRLTIETQNVEIDEASARRDGAAVPPGSYVRLCVSDSGVGMDEGTRARIFEPFFTTKGPGKGTGLGLATVYGIVKQSQGFIWVDSEVGQGTEVQIYLPQVTEAAGTDRLGPTVVSSSGNETILLVEDNEGLRKLAMRVLRPSGYTVLGAASGEEALRVLARHDAQVHLLLSDVVMPGMNGRELSERLAQTHPGMKVLYMSGYTSDTIVRHGVLEAQVPFLNKPFTAAALLRKVREVLDS